MFNSVKNTGKSAIFLTIILSILLIGGFTENVLSNTGSNSSLEIIYEDGENPGSVPTRVPTSSGEYIYTFYLFEGYANVDSSGGCAYVETTYDMKKDTHMELGLDDSNSIISNTDGDPMLISTYGLGDDATKSSDTQATKTETVEVNGVTYTVEYTASVSYDGRKHVSDTASSTEKKAADIHVEITASDGSSPEFRVKAYKNKNAGSSAYFKLKFNDKILNKAFKKKKFRFSIGLLELTADNTETVMNGKGTRIRILYLLKDEFILKVGRKNYSYVMNIDGKAEITGTNNCYGSFLTYSHS